jgi:hypothetical protein
MTRARGVRTSIVGAIMAAAVVQLVVGSAIADQPTTEK